MRYKLGVLFIIIIIGTAAVFGLIKRQSYTNLLGRENFMEQMAVAELSEGLAAHACAEMENTLSDAPIVLRVTPSNRMEYLFNAGRQRVTVQEVYRGDGMEQGQDIYITFSSWSVVLIEKYDTVQCGFVNIMKEGHEYLVFLSESFEGLDGERIYPLFGDTYVAPMFCYEETENVVIPIEEEHPTYVPYSLVKDNEFFVTSEDALQTMLDFKGDLLNRYPN